MFEFQVKYSLQKQSEGHSLLTHSFKYLGWLSFMQLAGSVAVHAYNAFNNRGNIMKKFKMETVELSEG